MGSVTQRDREGRLFSNAHRGVLWGDSMVKIKNPFDAVDTPNLLKVRLLSDNGLRLHALPGVMGKVRG